MRLPLFDAGYADAWCVRPSDVCSMVNIGDSGTRCIVYMRDGVQKVVALSVADAEKTLWPPRPMVPPPMDAAPFITCGRTWTVDGSRSTCFLTRGHEVAHRDPFTGAMWGDGATP